MMKAVNTDETRSAERIFPVKMFHGETAVVSSNSSVPRSRSLVIVPAENTGPTSTLNRTT